LFSTSLKLFSPSSGDWTDTTCPARTGRENKARIKTNTAVLFNIYLLIPFYLLNNIL
jgi:hypothetical protein